MENFDVSTELWSLLYDIDQAIDAKAAQDGGISRTDPLWLQRRQVRILLMVHVPDQCADGWLGDAD